MDLPFTGEVDWRGLAFIEVTGLAPEQRYVVTLAGPAGVNMQTFDADPSFAASTCFAYPQGDAPGVCLVTEAQASVRVAIDAANESARFVLDVHAIPVNEAPDEGNPLALAASSLPASVFAIPFETAFYEITGLTPGDEYVVTATGSTDVVSASVRVTQGSLDATDAQSAYEAQVVATPVGTSLYVSLIGNTIGTDVELAIARSTFVSQGTTSAPVIVAASALPLIGEVAAVPTPITGFGRLPVLSTYAITELTPGTYRVRMAAERGIALGLYGDRTDLDNRPGCIAGILDDVDAAECTVTITGTTLRLGVFNMGGAGSAIRVELDEAPYRSEGTPSAPVVRSIASALEGRVAALETSYYRLIDVEPGTPYHFALAAPSDGPLQAQIYAPGEPDPLCELSTASEFEGICVVTPESDQLEVQVSSPEFLAIGSDVGAEFTITADELMPRNEATELAPLTVACGSGAYSGEVGLSGASYYEIDGLTPVASYVVEVSEPTAPYELTTARINAWVGEAPCDQARGNDQVGRCRQTASDTGKLYVRIRAQPKMAFKLRVTAAASGSQGSALAPIAIAFSGSATAYVGRVAAAAPSYYKLSGLVPGKFYRLRVTLHQEWVELSFFRTSFDDVGPLLNTMLAQPGMPAEVAFPAPSSAVLFSARLSEVDSQTPFALEVTEY